MGKRRANDASQFSKLPVRTKRQIFAFKNTAAGLIMGNANIVINERPDSLCYSTESI